ncbi:MAG: BlaI/MecI/CopY family transcriptional regulator [Phycisphaerae bacterium]|jgi:predicted transcriptional regulator|nr:BlaI/MecI/CopY family transcriptional regulator [Phycisphaerae bacterium]
MRLNDSEWTVMNALWAACDLSEGEATAREVHDRIVDETEWAYNTVRSLLARLQEKRAVAERKDGNQCVYRPLISREDAQQSAVRSLLERAFDGTVGSLLLHLSRSEPLSKRDRDRLQSLVDEASAPKKPRAKGPRR